MPIPTKTSTTNTNPVAPSISRSASLRSRQVEDTTGGTQTKSSRSATRATTTSTNTATSDVQNRHIPRPTTRITPTSTSTQQPRIASSTATSTVPTRVTADRPASSSRSTSTSSTATRRAVDPPTSNSTAVSSRTAINKSRATSNNVPAKVPSSRIGSVTNRPIALSTTTVTTATRPKVTSRLPSPTKLTSTRANRDASSTSRPTSTASKHTLSTQPQTTLPPSSSSSSTTTNSLNNELLQLLHVHIPSTSTLNSYKASIDTHLQHTRTKVQAQETALLALETARRDALSTQALDSWLGTFTSNDAAARQIQVLSSAIKDLDVFRDDDGCIEMAPLREFESWVGDVLAIREGRGGSGEMDGLKGRAAADASNGSGTSTAEIKFIQPLGPAWTEAMHRLRETVAAIRDMLLGLGDVGGEDQETGIAGLVARQRAFAEVLLKEVEVAVGIEKMVMQAEREWEGREIERVLKELDLGGLENGNGDAAGEAGGEAGGRSGRIGAEAGIWA